MTTYQPAKITVSPNGALFIGGPWDSRLEEFEEFRPCWRVLEYPSPLSILEHGISHVARMELNEVTYRLERFAVTGQHRDRYWAIYIDDRLTLEEAFSKLFLSYALRASAEQCISGIEAVR